MITNTPTSAPQFKDKALVAEHVETQIKTTQGNTYFQHTLKEDITVQYTYTKREYAAGITLPVRKDEKGFYMLDGYNCHEIEGYILDGIEEKTNYLPLELFETKQYVIVKEFKTTAWEIK